MPPLSGAEAVLPETSVASSHDVNPNEPESAAEEAPEVRLDFEGVESSDESHSEVQELLVGPDAADDFAEQREALIERELPKVAETDDLLVPGWDSWAGEGAPERKSVPRWVRETQERQREARARALAERRDTGLQRTVISVQVPAALQAHQMKALPRGVYTTEELEERLSGGVGSDFVSETSYREAI